MKHQIEALGELLNRYRKTFLYFWSNRQIWNTHKYTSAEAEFLPAALALQEKPASKTLRYTALLLIAALIFAFIWSFFSKLEVIVNANGRIISAQRTKVISTPQNTIIKAIHVQEGSEVREGDVLVELNAIESESELLKLLSRLIELKIQVEKYKAFLKANDNVQSALTPHIDLNNELLSSIAQLLNINEGDPISTTEVPKFDRPATIKRIQWSSGDSRPNEQRNSDMVRRLNAESVSSDIGLSDKQRTYLQNVLVDGNQQLYFHHNMFRQKLAQYDAEIVRDTKTLPAAKELVAAYQKLDLSGDISRHAYLEKFVAYRNLEGQLASLIAQRAFYIAQTKREAWDAIVDAEKTIAMTKNDAVRFNSISSTLKLRTPVNGTVQQMTVHTINGVAAGAQPLMSIVPEGNDIEVTAYVANKDIGFVQKGQHAYVKVEAFDYTKFGTVPAKVVLISSDVVLDEGKQPAYAVTVLLDQQSINAEGMRKKLAAGMSVTVEIKTGERRLIEYLLSPIVKSVSEAMHER